MTNSPETLALHDLLKRGNKHTFRRGQIIQSSDGRLRLSLIDKGYVKRYQIGNDGSIGIHGIYGPNNFFPLTLVYELLFAGANTLYSGPETFYYETVTDSVICSIDSDKLVRAVKVDPLLYRGLLAEAGRRLHTYIQRAENVTLKTAYKRVAHQLVFWARQYGRQLSNGSVLIQLPVTHQMLGDVLSLTRETVSQSMGELRQRGLIKTRGQHVIVVNLNELDELARE